MENHIEHDAKWNQQYEVVEKDGWYVAMLEE